LGDNPIHVDLYDLSHVQELEIEVPIQFVGKPAGVELGGTFEAVMHTLTIKTSPKNIPERIAVDVSSLGLGEVLHVRDIPVPEGCLVLDSPEETVALVLEPEVEEIEQETEEEEEATASAE
jgi:large subunit ribosomal protein L25